MNWKRCIWLTFSVLFCSLAHAQTLSTTKNFIAETIVKVSDKTSLSQLDGLTKEELIRNVQYLDGFGRPMQSISIQASPSGNDLVQLFEFNSLHRERLKYLPYVPANGNTGKFRESVAYEAYQFYNPGTGIPLSNGITRITSPYTENVFEPSPLGRVVEQAAPGNIWHVNNGHTVKIVYASNNTNTNYIVDGFAVRKYYANTVNTTGLEHQRSLSTTGYYNANELYITITKDENWIATEGKAGTVEEYKDKNGAIVLKRTFNRSPNNVIEVLSTYYVYDDYGVLSFVLPPATNPDNGTISQVVLDNYAYQYYYDARGRLIEKKIPSKGWEYVVYNNLNQPVFSQNAEQGAKSPKEWNFVKYDAFGRSIITGIVQNNGSRVDLQNVIDNLALTNSPLWEERDNSNSNGTHTGYSNLTLPTQNILAYYSISYYDDYNFYNNTFGAPNGGSFVNGSRVKALPTGSKMNIIGPNGAQRNAQNMLLQVRYYDDKARLKQSKIENHLNGVDVLDNTYSFIDELKSSTLTHTVGTTSVTTTVIKEYFYDHAGRKTKTYQTINTNSNIGARVLLSELIYNEVGQVIEKKLHNGLQSTVYGYNERGWLKNSTSNQFSYQLNYNDPTSGTTPQYNGNIANQLWGYGNNPNVNTFSYSYDKLDRLVQAASPNLGENVVYDLMGNIQSLYREGKGTNNYVGYVGNKLTQVQGFTNGSYNYDQNGNLISDSQKGVNILYNSLNLPSQVSGNQSITYLYDATGNKLQKQSSSGVTDYINGIQYKSSGSKIDIILTEEGNARNNAGSYSYEYTLADHIGNSRLSFKQDPITFQLEVLQKDDYYAFGYRKPEQISSNDNKYLYNGKELQDELEEYDYGARFYNPVLARWNSVDPMAEKMRSFSPYNYALNNPINLNDPDGMMPVPISGIPGLSIPVPTTRAELASAIVSLNNMQIQLLKDVSMMTTMKNTMEHLEEYAINELSYGMHRGRGYEAMLKSGEDPGLIDLEYNLNKAIATAKLVGDALEWLAFGAGGGEMMLAASAIKAPAMAVVKEVAKEAAQEPIKVVEKKTAAELAANWQGKGTYTGVDNWKNVTLTDGKYIVGGLPGQSNYYTTLNGLNRSGLDKTTLFEGLQVSKHPQFGYREQVGIYRVTGKTPAAFGTTYANPQFGAGGLPQLYIPDYSGLQLIKTIPLK